VEVTGIAPPHCPPNLGIRLGITSRHDAELTLDADQTPPPFPPFLTLPAQSGAIFPTILSIITIKQDSDLTGDAESLYYEADQWIRDLFAQKGISTHLDTTFAHHFTTLLIIDPSTRQLVATCEAVFMRKYLWIEVLAVKDTWRRRGVGRAIMERLMSWAKGRSKEMGLFAVWSAVPFYDSLGLGDSSKWPPKQVK